MVRRKPGRPFEKVLDLRESGGFIVRDDDVTATIDRATVVKLLVDADTVGEPTARADDVTQTLLREHGSAPDEARASFEYAWYEGIFAQGEQVLVLGRIARSEGRIEIRASDDPVTVAHVDRDARKTRAHELVDAF